MAENKRIEREPSEDARQAILAAARTEFAREGHRAASVRAIASRAGVTAAMINYYFGSKRALYDLIVEEAQAKLFARVSAEVVRGGREMLAARLAGAYFDFLSEEREFQRLMLRQVLDADEGLEALVRVHVDPLRVLFETQFGADDDTFQRAVSLFGAVAGYFIYEPVLSSLTGRDLMSDEQLKRRRAHIVELASVMSSLDAENR